MAIVDYGAAFRASYDHGERRQRRSNTGAAMRRMRNALASRDPEALIASRDDFLNINEPDHYAWATENVARPRLRAWGGEGVAMPNAFGFAPPQATMPTMPSAQPDLPAYTPVPLQPLAGAPPAPLAGGPNAMVKPDGAKTTPEGIARARFGLPEPEGLGGAAGAIAGAAGNTPQLPELPAPNSINPNTGQPWQLNEAVVVGGVEYVLGRTQTGSAGWVERRRLGAPEAPAPDAPAPVSAEPAADAAGAPDENDGGFQDIDFQAAQSTPQAWQGMARQLYGMWQGAAADGDTEQMEQIGMQLEGLQTMALDAFNNRTLFALQQVELMRGMPEDQRLPYVINALQTTPYAQDPFTGEPLLATDLVPMLQQLGRDGIQDSELDAFAEMGRTLQERVAARLEERQVGNETAGRAQGYSAPSNGEILQYERGRAREDERTNALYSLDSIESAFMALARNEHTGTIVPDHMNRTLAQLAGDTGRAALLEDMRSNTWPLILQALRGLQPISNTELAQASRAVLNGTWTLESATNFLRKARAALEGARALDAARNEFIFEGGSLQRGVNARGERWTEVERRVTRPYSRDNWETLAGADQSGEVYVPGTGDVFTYDPEHQAWQFQRHEEPNQRGRTAPRRADAEDGPVRVSTPAEARALRPGTRYTTPDGREFIR
jgi:hypothetical protein